MDSRTEFSALLEAIYNSIGNANGWAPVLEDLSNYLNSTVGNVFLRPPDQELYLIDTVIGADPAVHEAYREISHLDVRWPASLENMGTIINDVEAFRHGEYENSLVYQEIFRQHKLRHSMTTVLPISEGLVGGLALMREEKMGSYQPAEVQSLKILLPHIARAMALQRRMQDLAVCTDNLIIALNRLPMAGIVLTASRKVVCMNDQAERLLQGSGLNVVNQHLRAHSARSTNRLTEVIANASLQADGHFEKAPGLVPILSIPRPSQRPLEILAIPLRRRDFLRTKTNAQARVLTLIYDPEHRPRIDHRLLEPLFDLTSSEAAIAARLAEGYSLQEIAAIRCCS